MITSHVDEFAHAIHGIGPGPKARHLARRAAKKEAKAEAKELARVKFLRNLLPTDTNRLLPQIQLEPGPEFYPGMGPLYHGARAPISELSQDAIGTASVHNALGPAFYGAFDMGYARNYGDHLYNLRWRGAHPPNILDMDSSDIPEVLSRKLAQERSASIERTYGMKSDIDPFDAPMVDEIIEEVRATPEAYQRAYGKNLAGKRQYQMTKEMSFGSYFSSNPTMDPNYVDTGYVMMHSENVETWRGINRSIEGLGFDAMQQYESFFGRESVSPVLALLNTKDIELIPATARIVRPLQVDDIQPRKISTKARDTYNRMITHKSSARQAFEQQQQVSGSYVGMPLDRIQTRRK